MNRYTNADTGGFSEQDIYLFKQGNYFRAYETFGAHIATVNGEAGTRFAVWANNAESVSVIGDFNDWNPARDVLLKRPDDSGIWEGFIPGAGHGARYKYRITPRAGKPFDKGDPYAFFWETAPRTASIVWELVYEWNDAQWMRERKSKNALDAPWSVYEVHPGSWKRNEVGGFLTYRELAQKLASYAATAGYTHVELLPIMEHPFYGSWGYQPLGYFAPTSRYGTPGDFMFFVDCLHASGIGVILDWVPSHFPTDAHGLFRFDGGYAYEYADARKGFHPDWKSAIFDYGRNEVRDFLISSALFWLDKYHADGLRVDAVSSMLFLDYSRKEGEWIPNRLGGRENLEAIELLTRFNTAVYESFPDVQTIAEESSAWPSVTRPVHLGGLGFGMKWNMGWMHDILAYMSEDPIFRKYHHDRLTFGIWYAFSENFMLPLSHDEVVYGKGSLYGKMPGDEWQKLASLRLLFGFMFTHPGKKLLFMGGDRGKRGEWNHDDAIDWEEAAAPSGEKLASWIRDLNRVYRMEPALFRLDGSPRGFAWMDSRNWEQSVASYIRETDDPADTILVVCNFTPVPRYDYVVAAPASGFWEELLNSDSRLYGGSNTGNLGGVHSSLVRTHGENYSIRITLPPLAIVAFKRRSESEPEANSKMIAEAANPQPRLS